MQNPQAFTEYPIVMETSARMSIKVTLYRAHTLTEILMMVVRWYKTQSTKCTILCERLGMTRLSEFSTVTSCGVPRNS
jgi:hypothetical protein